MFIFKEYKLYSNAVAKCGVYNIKCFDRRVVRFPIACQKSVDPAKYNPTEKLGGFKSGNKRYNIYTMYI